MEFTNPQYLVTTEWLADHLQDPAVRILDVTAKLTSALENRAEAECYEGSHIPGSLFFDVPAGKGVLSNQDDRLPWMWPSPDQMTATLGSVGVGPDTKVVLVAGRHATASIPARCGAPGLGGHCITTASTAQSSREESSVGRLKDVR